MEACQSLVEAVGLGGHTLADDGQMGKSFEAVPHGLAPFVPACLFQESEVQAVVEDY